MFGPKEAYKRGKWGEWSKRFQSDIGMSCPWKSELLTEFVDEKRVQFNVGPCRYTDR
jgi:hypothetical protein